METDTKENETDKTDSSDEPVKVEFFGAEVHLPRSQADFVIKERNKMKEEHQKAVSELDAIKAKALEDARKAKEADDRAKAVELAQNGKIEEAQRIWTEESNREKAELLEDIKNDKLNIALGSRDDLLDGTADVVAKLISKQVAYDPKAKALFAVGEDGHPATNDKGEPLTVDAVVDQFLSDYPALVKAKAPAQSGGNPQQPQGSGRIVSRAEFESWRPLKQSRFYAEGGKVRD